ncbi:EamA family transporter [Pseudovibrio exalbescens]|uniref:EamA family transporter n=1 Tax=Pseudovibrio exalbescens TaxID=197461 RepID=UPI002365B293|nr:EamA family transporter [Pseudovibrio exalbescens]MDD7911532.1 EamA family transporter [Pseudovibrio exalbescens]
MPEVLHLPAKRRHLGALHGVRYRPHLIALIQVSLGIVLLFPLASFDALAEITSIEWSYLLVLGGVHTMLMYILMYSAFQMLPTPVIAVMSFIYPVVAIGVDNI